MDFATNKTEQVEISIQQAKAKVAKRDALRRLITNEDFKQVIMEEYFKEYAVSLVMLKADPSQETDKEQADLDKAIIGIGQLEQFFKGILIQGNMADKSIADDEETLQELLNEDVQG